MIGYTVSLQRRLETNRLRGLITPFVSIVAALIVAGVFLIWEGFSPVTVYQDLFEASFTSRSAIADSLTIAIPLTLTGLAAAIAFRMNLFNIGAEGQLYLGAIASSWAGIALAPDLPGVFAVLVVLIAGALGGALWALPAGIFKVRFGTSEIISTLMLTFVALFLMRYLVFGSHSYWRDPNSPTFPQGRKIDSSAELGTFGDTRLHWGIAVALLAVVVIWGLVRFTSTGFNMNVVGSSAAAARYAGIRSGRVITGALVISGALAGLAGATEIAGRAHGLDPDGLALNLGFTGIVVAALARYNPFGVVVVAVFMGGLRNAGPALQISGDRVPPEVSLMLQGAILLFAIGGEVFTRNRLVISRRTSGEVAVTQ
ncbi:MAG: ABC transporter permease [Acidobacteria bacterium]|nr:ABC transporter permease [Acidobacteriota bacterium]